MTVRVRAGESRSVRYVRVSRLLTLLALVSLFTSPSAESLGTEKPWFGGLYAGTCGFSESTGLPAAEYCSVGLFIEPLSLPAFNPALHAGVLLPITPWDKRGVRWQLGGELSIFDLPAPRLKHLFYNEINWSPGTGAEALANLDFSAASVNVLIAPLRFRAGDGVFSLCTAHLVFDPAKGFAGWGITLFRAALFLW
jgi:hypothetical protein